MPSFSAIVRIVPKDIEIGLTMSHSFHIRNVNKLSYQHTLDNLGISNLLLTDDSPQPENNNWPEGDAYLYIDQISVRPIETSYCNGTFSARIFSNSSPRDYDLAIKLIAEIAKQNSTVIEPEDNTAMDVDSFLIKYDNDWIKEHCTSMVKMLIGSYQYEQATYTLAGTIRNLEAGPRFFGQLLANPKTVVSEFYDRFRMLNYLEDHDFYIASGIRLQNETGDLEVVTSVYGPDVATVLCDGADAINVRSEDSEHYFVTLEQLAAALGEKAVWLSETVLLAPAIMEPDWHTLIDAIKPVAKIDVFEFGRTAEENSSVEHESYKALFTKNEWQKLLYTPIVVFALIASADGSIDKKEIQGFQQQLIQGPIADNHIMRQLMMDVLPNLEQLMRDVLEGIIDPKSILEEITAAVDTKLTSEDAMQYKLSLMQIGKTVAESSGGILGLFGDNVSNEEQQTLSALKTILKIAPLH